MYKIVPAERQECSEETITKNRCKPSKNGLQRSFLAPPAGFEPVACRLGGDRSIQLSYGGLYRKYSLLQGSRIRTIRFLGDMFVELPAMSSHISLCISTMLRLLSISLVVQYSQLSEPFITKVIVSKKLAAIFQTAN